MSVFKGLYEYRELLKTSIKKDIRGKYKSSILGVIWSFLNPLLQLAVYAIVFPLIMKSNIPNYTVFVCCGLIPWTFFSTAISRTSFVMVENANIIKKVYFPREILPISIVTSEMVNFIISTVIILAFVMAYGIGFSWYIVFYPVILIIQYILLIGISLLVSSITVYIRDLQHFIGILLQLLFYATPIVYASETIPANFQWILKYNPMTYIIEGYRNIFYYQTMPDIKSLLVVLVGSIALCVVGYLKYSIDCKKNSQKNYSKRGGSIMKEEKIAVLIPCYNEELTIEKVIKDFRRELPEADIYVYNNNSKDRTEEIAKKNGAIVVNEYRQGKGNVVRSMFRDIEADIYVMVDGDDTYPAEFVHKLIEPIREGKADMAIGDRLSNGTYQKENKRHFHEFGNNLVKKAINLLFKTDLKDIMTGYRAFNRMFVKNMPVLSPNFEIETEMSLYALDKKYIIKEIPIDYRDRPEGSSSKLNTVGDGIKVVKTIVRMFKDYRPFAFFTIVALVFLICGLAVGIPVLVEFFKTSIITKMPSAILATGFVSLAAISFQCGVILDTITRQHKEAYELNLLKWKQIENK